MSEDRFYDLLHRLDTGPVEPDPSFIEALWERLDAALMLEDAPEEPAAPVQAVIDMRERWERPPRRRVWRRALVLTAAAAAVILLALLLVGRGDDTEVQPADTPGTSSETVPATAVPPGVPDTPEAEAAVALVDGLGCERLRGDEWATLVCNTPGTELSVFVGEDPWLASVVRGVYYSSPWAQDAGVIVGNGWAVIVNRPEQTEVIQAAIGGTIVTRVVESSTEEVIETSGPIPTAERSGTSAAGLADVRVFTEADGLPVVSPDEPDAHRVGIDVYEDGTTWADGPAPARLEGERWIAYELPEDRVPDVLVAGPAGTAWAIGASEPSAGQPESTDVYYFDGSTWSAHPESGQLEIDGFGLFDVDDEGTLWTTHPSVDPLAPLGSGLVRLDPDGYELVDGPDGGFVCAERAGRSPGFCRYSLDRDGAVWALRSQGTARLDESGWAEFPYPPDVTVADALDWMLGSDGVSWIFEHRSDPKWLRLESRDGTTAVTTYPIDVAPVEVDKQCAVNRGLSEADAELLDTAELRLQYLTAVMVDSEVAADGSVWTAVACVGITRLDEIDGSTTVYGLDLLPSVELGDYDGFADDLAIHPDGSIWTTATGDVIRLAPQP